MTSPALAALYSPTQAERSRQNFVAALKGFANGSLEAELAELYTVSLEPGFRAEQGRAPADRKEGRALFEPEPLYQLWGSMVYASQGLMWESVGQTCRRIREAFEARAAAVTRAPRGSLALDPGLQIPRPIAAVEIHRQPGGYFGASRPDDLFAPLIYFGTIELYRAAKGLTAGAAVGEPGIGRYIAAVIRRRYPGLAPRRILDLGCGPGIETLGLKEAFPDAEVHGCDLSAPFVRFAHAWAEDRGVAIHYRQADAQHTGYPDGHFDLVVSHILFHETWHDIVPRIFAEARRILAPGGVFLNADVPYQPSRMPIPKQVTNDWQVRNNGEPFWTGFADTDVRAALAAAGFEPAGIVADYEPLDRGHYFFFGGTRAVAGGTLRSAA
jgi:SAM-dependent methyltransferase